MKHVLSRLARKIAGHRGTLALSVLSPFVHASTDPRAFLTQASTRPRAFPHDPLPRRGNEAGTEETMVEQVGNPLGVFDIRVG
jgi:hypothetical protein